MHTFQTANDIEREGRSVIAQALTGRHAFVSGSTSGIGAAIALALAARGATIIVHGRNQERAREIAERIRGDGGKARVVLGDLESDAAAQEVIEAVMRETEGVDILVNAVGGPGEGLLTWDNTTPEQWLAQFELNVLSAVRLINAFIPGMKSRGWGRVIQISSIAANRPLPNQVPAYCACKASLISLTASLAKTVACYGVMVNTVSPGFVLTPALKQYLLAAPEYAGKSWDEVEPAVAQQLGIATGRFGKTEEIGALVAFLAGPEASWITGSNFRIDGGTAGYVD